MILQLLVAGCSADPAGEPWDEVCPDPSPRREQPFDVVEIPGDAIPDHRFVGAGIVAGDFDGDGDVDLVAPGPLSARLLVNDGRGGFVDDPGALPDLDYTDAVGGAAADFDADGDLDLVITRFLTQDHLLRNEGGRFVRHDQPEMPLETGSQSATFADLDLDGNLDLLIAGHGYIDRGKQLVITEPSDPSHLWLGDGAGGFVDATDRLGEGVHRGYTFVIGVTDLENDGLPDLLVANDYPYYMPTIAARNRGDGTFGVAEGSLGLNIVAAGMGLGIGDINHDGLDDFLLPVWDRIVVLRSGESNWVNAGQALGFEVPRAETDEEWVGWGAEWVDLDNDGDLDGLVAFGHIDPLISQTINGETTDNADEQRMIAYLNDGTGAAFTADSGRLGLDRGGVWRGLAVADLNGDGWPDVAARDLSGRIVVWLSRCGRRAWLTVRPEEPHRAVGAQVEVVAGARSWRRRITAGGTSLASSGPPEAMFGLGRTDQVDDVIVRWPDGVEVHTGPLRTRQVVTVPRD